MVRLSVERLVKSYGSKQVLSGVTLDVNEGEFSVLLGPSGSGKTTLLRCIAGLETPNSGRILFDGEDYTSVPTRMRDVSVVFQNYALFPLMTVMENIAFPLRIRNLPKDEVERQARGVAQMLKIDQLLQRKPKELSGGEQQRVAVARAMVRKPRLFLMDEPLSNLDAPLRAEMRTELKKLHSEIGITTVYVTHDQAEAMSLADRMGVMNSGDLLQYDSPENVYNHPTSLFVAHFVGAYPSNIFDVTYSSNGGDRSLHGAGFDFPLAEEVDLPALRDSQSKTLVLSIRPEDLRWSPTKLSEGSIPGRVELLESLGSSMLVEVATGQDRFMVLAPLDPRPEVGSEVWLTVLGNRFHIFDKVSGLSLL